MELFVSFSEIMHFFKRNLVKFILVVLAFGIVCGLMPLKYFHQSYSANATITFSCEVPEDAGTEYRLQYTGILSTRVQTALATAGSNSLLQKTAAKLGIDPAVISKISGDQLLGAPMVKVTIRTTDGSRAAEIANTAAQILADDTVQKFPSPKLTASVTDQAKPVSSSSRRSSVMKGGILGLILGFVVYIVYGLICVLGDRSVRNSRFAEESIHIKLLGEIPHDKRDGAREDAFRRARSVALHQLGDAHRIVVESISLGDGGEATAAGLAVSLAKAGRKVLLVDGDLRDPKLAKMLGVTPQKTLEDVLKGVCTAEEAASTVPDCEGLRFIAGAKTEENPADLLARTFGKFMADVDSAYDYLLVYAPAQSAYPDAGSLMESSQGVVLNAKYGSTTYLALKNAVQGTTEAGGKIAGFVVSDV